MEKRKLLTLGLTISLMFGLVACGNSSDSSDDTQTENVEDTGETEDAQEEASEEDEDIEEEGDTASSPSSEKTTVEFWHSMSGDNLEVLESIVDTFNGSQNEVEVVATYQGDYYTSAAKVVADIAVGAGPDLVQMGSGQVVILSQEDVTENLLNYMGEDTGVFLEDFTEGFYIDYYDEEDDFLNALPMGCSIPVLFVNTDILDEAGVEIPTTWEEMEETCLYLKENGYCDFGFSQPRDAWYFWMMIDTYGGPVFSEDGLSLDCYDNGTLEESFGLLLRMVEDDTFRPAPSTEGANTIRGWFAEGDCAFLIQSIGSLETVRAACEETGVNVEVAQVPGHEIDGEINYAVPYGGNTMVMLKDSENKDAAWQFLQWLYTSEDGLAYFDYCSGYLACSDTIMNSSLLTEKAGNDADWARAHEYLDTISTDYMIEAFGDAADDIMEFMDAVFYDEMDPIEAMDQQLDDINDILAEHEGRP